jgi:hypothetical protein
MQQQEITRLEFLLRAPPACFRYVTIKSSISLSEKIYDGLGAATIGGRSPSCFSLSSSITAGYRGEPNRRHFRI